jgi:hypothetical protein
LAYGPGGEQLSRTLPLGFGPDGIRGTGDDPQLPEGDFTEEFRYDNQLRQVLHVSFEGVVAQRVYHPATGRIAETRFFDNLTQYADGTGTAGEVWTYKHDAFSREIEVTQEARTGANGARTGREQGARTGGANRDSQLLRAARRRPAWLPHRSRLAF